MIQALTPQERAQCNAQIRRNRKRLLFETPGGQHSYRPGDRVVYGAEWWRVLDADAEGRAFTLVLLGARGILRDVSVVSVLKGDATLQPTS